ncbi:TniQ family protein [Marinicella marina]|uniref:TniQ family protein n=1 Tax=Marinicella marina TaxID=2996016 RepID=UPI0024BD1E83|nr:TniQ family protein [Marinicella marina]MDJ1138793.1 TniQ family protein [Marinicella marina]
MESNDDKFLLTFPPLQDELLSSWIVRLSNGHGALLHTFCRLLWPGQSIWTRDIDTHPPSNVIDILAYKTGTSIDKIIETTMLSYESKLFEKVINSNNHWILAQGTYHRVRHRKALQFCPECLEEDDSPYFRKHWRLGWNTICLKHSRPLRSDCSFCGEKIMVHKLLWESGKPYCPSCNQSLARSKHSTLNISNELFELNKMFFSIIKNGSVRYFDEVISAVEFCYGLRIFTSALVRNNNLGRKLLKLGLKELSLDPHWANDDSYKFGIFELVDLNDRHLIMSVLAFFICMDKKDFTKLLRSHRIGSSVFLRTEYQSFPKWLNERMELINLNHS